MAVAEAEAEFRTAHHFLSVLEPIQLQLVAEAQKQTVLPVEMEATHHWELFRLELEEEEAELQIPQAQMAGAEEVAEGLLEALHLLWLAERQHRASRVGIGLEPATILGLAVVEWAQPHQTLPHPQATRLDLEIITQPLALQFSILAVAEEAAHRQVFLGQEELAEAQAEFHLEPLPTGQQTLAAVVAEDHLGGWRVAMAVLALSSSDTYSTSHGSLC